MYPVNHGINYQPQLMNTGCFPSTGAPMTAIAGRHLWEPKPPGLLPRQLPNQVSDIRLDTLLVTITCPTYGRGKSSGPSYPWRGKMLVPWRVSLSCLEDLPKVGDIFRLMKRWWIDKLFIQLFMAMHWKRVIQHFSYIFGDIHPN